MAENQRPRLGIKGGALGDPRDTGESRIT